MLEFDPAGNLVNSWGGQGQGYDWPDSNHGITVDYKGNVWIGGNGRGNGQLATANEGQVGGVQPFNDNMVLKFTKAGKFLMQIGKPGKSKGSNDTENLRLPAKTYVDPQTNELFVADGYGNHRVIVFDAETGKYKRHWGAYGHKCRTMWTWGPISRTIRRRSSSGIRCTAPRSRSIACCMSATA